MYRTASKKTETNAWIILTLLTVSLLVMLPEIIVSFFDENYSQYGILDAVVTVFLLALSTFLVVYIYYVTVLAVVYSRTLCAITSDGIKVHYRCHIKKDFLLSWDDIDRVVLSPTGDNESTLQIVCFAAELAKKSARKLSIESKCLKDWSFFVMHQKKSCDYGVFFRGI